MDKSQIAQARRASYALFGRIFLKGASVEDVALLKASLDFSPGPEMLEPDLLAARHYNLFGMNVFPYEGIFLDDSGLLGGQAADEVLGSFADFGFEVDTTSESADHLGNELTALAALCQAEADSRKANLQPLIQSRQDWQRDLLETHLLRWLGPFVLAVRQQGDDFFTAVANLTFDLAVHHYTELGPGAAVARKNLPHPPEILHDDKTGLKEIAHYLITPSYSGFYLSRDDIGRLGRQLNLPRGFGDRQQLLVNLMRTAVQYNSLPNLLDSLANLAAQWQAAYQETVNSSPQLAPFTAVWQDRINLTRDMLAQIAAKIQTVSV